MAQVHKVHAVALAGDLVERTNARFEAYGPLKSGLLELEKAGIKVLAVAGNHDTEVLPGLAEVLDSLILLGPNGTWTSHTIDGDEDLAIHLVGWSFPNKHVHRTPLPPTGLPDNFKHPVFGMMHADLDQPNSQYAPVSRHELERTNYKAWFLGHIHKPGLPNTDGNPFYLGSTTGLHPGETGVHGPVLVDINRQGDLSMKRHSLAPLRWVELSISCDVLDADNGNPGKLILNSLVDWTIQNAANLNSARAVGFRLTLTGVLDQPERLRKMLLEDELLPENLITKHAGLVLFVDQLSNQTIQRLDLLEIARTTTPEGLLARRILVLENPSVLVPGVVNPAAFKWELIRKGSEKLQEINQRPVYGRLNKTVDQNQVCQLLIKTGRQALEAIIQQREADSAVN